MLLNVKQHTIKAPISISGVGLHTGESVTMTFKPAEENFGYQFQRIDLADKPIIRADIDNVVDLSRGTTIGINGTRIGTVEHALAALAGLQIDNVLIEIDAAETPIMDGSAKQFIDALIKVGVEEQDADREYFVVKENIHYGEDERKVEMIAMPLDSYRLTVMVDYNSPVLGTQHASISHINDFKDEIASCRTFCFLHELEELVSQNLIKGGDLNNAIVVVDKVVDEKELKHLRTLFNRPNVSVGKDGILDNVKLRYQNEPARHKLLDVVGDLALIGMPLKAQIMAVRPGHSANIAFARKIKELIKKEKSKNHVPKFNITKAPIFGIKEIEKLLPHRPPFLLLDKVMELSDKHVVGIKNVTMNEPFFEGHFPGNPVMPGVLQIEALAQLGGVFVLSSLPDPENYWTYFMKIDKVRFKGKVVPGDTMVLRCELMTPIRRGICLMKCVAYVGDKIVVEGELMAQIVKKEKAESGEKE
ncbi:MAG: bifunctional UDP-3-O-[3-hydroxymyristoyl] N-acetylglucosamine deacetylase/3-hydroxyacyl-ACP dehydratase [Bacteroidia bacterium]|nr:bifunctional UDP-3-O-[3-hydroxymyristoyl] N-acetylglucosamine deacetylase/3-hydroxyacyl-ACP dehydratase [Bacteroidia bacterium]